MTTRIIKVVAANDGAGGMDFEVDGMKANHAVLTLHKDSGEHTLHFELHDGTDRDLRFHAEDPIWVDEDCPCPPGRGINSDQITIVEVTPKRLVATNANSGRARDIRYQLNFVDAGGARAECDPIIQNGGGIKPPIG